MKNRILQIALKIALLMEEYSEADIVEAVRLLGEKGSSSALFAHLRGCKGSSKTTLDSPRKAKRLDAQRSKAVIDLEQKDPEKYRILSESDSLLRQGSVLPRLEDIMRLGEQLSKDFAPKRSRKEAISKLMTLLAQKPIDEIKQIHDSIISSASLDKKKSGYQELAQFIITGKNTQPLSEKM
jgi:hypothetical protein